MSENLLLQRMFSLRQLVLHKLSRILWGNFVLRETLREEYISDTHTDKLVDFRLNTYPEFIFQADLLSLPIVLRELLVEVAVRMQQGFSEALAWENECEAALPFTTLNPVIAGPYWAGHFITPAGQFDHLSFAKKFVDDETQPVLYRFKLACFYCFEDVLVNLWNTIQSNSELYNEFERASSSTWELDTWWTFWLKHFGKECTNNDVDYVGSFYACGLREAVSSGHEYAARFFWNRCSLAEKEKFLSEFNCNTLTDAAMNNQVRFVYFIYSVLPIKQKKRLITWTARRREIGCIWYCLLQSPFYEIILNDIFTFPHPIPAKFYEKVFSSLIDLIENQKIPVHKEIFKALWNHLSLDQKKDVLRVGSYMVGSLMDIDATDLMDMIVTSVPDYASLNSSLPVEWNPV